MLIVKKERTKYHSGHELSDIQKCTVSNPSSVVIEPCGIFSNGIKVYPRMKALN